MRRRQVAALAVTLVLIAGCGAQDGRANPPSADSDPAPSATATTASDTEQRHPDIIAVEITETQAGVFSLNVTVSSPYDTAKRYADGWRVLDPDGHILGEHTLSHDHASEQPFTRTQSGVEIPKGVSSITVEGRDQEFGYGGESLTVDVPSR